jgi:hypothetical protein
VGKNVGAIPDQSRSSRMPVFVLAPRALAIVVLDFEHAPRRHARAASAPYVLSVEHMSEIEANRSALVRAGTPQRKGSTGFYKVRFYGFYKVRFYGFYKVRF